MRRPRPIPTRIAERRRNRETLACAILARVTEMANEAATWQTDCTQLRDNLDAYFHQSVTQGSAVGGFAEAGNTLRAAVPKLVSLGHDVEVMVPISSVIRQLGLQLDRIVPRIEHQLGRGVMLTIEQAGTADIVFASGPDCLVTLADHATLNIPVVLTISNQRTDFSLNASFAIQTLDPFHRQFQIILTRGAHICPPADLEPALLEPLLNRIDSELKRIDGRIIDTGALPDFGSQFPDPYAARLGSHVRLHFALARRNRREVAPLGDLPAWADTGIKVVPETLHSILRDKVSRSGFTITGISHPALNVADVHAFKEIKYTKRILKTDFGVRIRVAAMVRCLIRVTANRNLSIRYRSTDIHPDIDIVPRMVGSLFVGAEVIAERLVDGFIRDVSGEELVQLPSSRRTEVAVTSEGLTLHLKKSFG